MSIEKIMDILQKQKLVGGVVSNTAMERISSGLTVNSAKDNVQYDAMAKRLTADLRTNEVGMINIADGVSMLSTRETYLSKLVDFMTEIKKCAMRGVNGGADTNGASIAIVDSKARTPMERKSAEQGKNYEFNFSEKYEAGDVLQFQVGT
ncbi:MAG: hypothetical protein EB068_04460, partial [Betaproteobacteria bacterium]|nr:hypothetical protein [Betaproteobacteria bacterium]